MRYLSILFVALIIWNAGCATRLQPDPLAGWKGLGSAYVISCPFGKSIESDFRSYIAGLPREERRSVVDDGLIRFFEDGPDHRAVEIRIPLNGIRWKHVLFYDRDGKRTKFVKYASSRYRC